MNVKLGAEETVYMEVPECYSEQVPDQVLKLKKAIYGLKSSPRLWNKTLDAFFAEMEFKPSAVDESTALIYGNKMLSVHS